MKKTFESMNEETTFEYARAMGEKAKPGDIIALTGEMGAGKTVFAKGFAKGLGVKETVNSPTFTLVQIYDDGRLPLYHFDVYRIEDPSEMEETGFDDDIEGSGVTLVEWADRIRDLMPESTVWIRMFKDPEVDDDYRRLEIEDTGN